MSKTYPSVIFGPVRSRRLGISLGIDLLPKKTCTHDCVFCEVGKTTAKTMEREEFYPLEEIKRQFNEFLKDRPKLDWITFAGSGEPMLYSRFGELVDFLKDTYPEYKICLLTNSAFLDKKEYRDEMQRIDRVVPSLNAATPTEFNKINRPKSEMDFDGMLKGLVDFSNEYNGELVLEVFIVPGINDTLEAIEAIVEISRKMDPMLIQLNSLDRPGTVSTVEQATPGLLRWVKEQFGELNVEVVSKFKGTEGKHYSAEDIKKLVVETVDRRPCTAEDFSEITGTSLNEVIAILHSMVEDGTLSTKEEARGIFYLLK